MTRVPGRTGTALVAVITIVDEEHDAVRHIGGFQNLAGGTPYLYRNALHADGEANRYDVILAKSADRGNTPCGQLVERICEHFRPQFIVLSGIAGGVGGRDGVSLGDVIIADHVEYYEMRKLSTGSDGPLDQVRRLAFDHPSIFLRDTVASRVAFRSDWIANVTAERPEEGTPKRIVGNLIAGEKILGDGENEYQRKILSEFDKAIAVDMESYGLAREVYAQRGAPNYNLNYLVVRGISDLVDDPDNNDKREEWREYAASTAAAFAMSVVDEIVALVSDTP